MLERKEKKRGEKTKLKRKKKEGEKKENNHSDSFFFFFFFFPVRRYGSSFTSWPASLTTRAIDARRVQLRTPASMEHRVIKRRGAAFKREKRAAGGGGDGGGGVDMEKSKTGVKTRLICELDSLLVGRYNGATRKSFPQSRYTPSGVNCKGPLQYPM